MSQCEHIDRNVLYLDAKRFKKKQRCDLCDYDGPNLWICLERTCKFIACSEQAKDHSTKHFQLNDTHCVHMNISSQRAWCYICDCEIVLEKKTSPLAPIVTALNDNYECFNPSMGLVGLQNLANTCYMNSALQALSNIEHLTHYFLNCSDLMDNVLEQGAHRCRAGLAKSYQSLIRDIWTNKADNLAPSGILHGIRRVHTMFRGFQQHDTQEFLRCFMDQLHEELKELKPAAPYLYVMQNQQSASPIDNDESSLNSRSSSPSETEYESCDSSCFEYQNNLTEHLNSRYHRVALSKEQSKECSIISEVFDGKLLSEVQCLTCDRVSKREETFQDLSLPIPSRDFLNVLHQAHSLSSVQILPPISTSIGRKWISWVWNFVRSWFWGPSVSLHDCMASFFSADELKGENMYSCEKCNKLRTGVKYSRILFLPEMLCIHLKRFRHDLSYSSKIYSHVHFPLEYLDMKPYLHKDCTSHVALYNLSSVICHHGTVGGGHYTCYVRNLFVNRWYEFDDHHVTEVSADVVRNCQAYVLFYRKYNPHMDLLRVEAKELSILKPPNLSDICFYVSREWLLRLNTFAEPGPINNCTILCPHGGLLQSKMALSSRIAVPISQSLWDFLYNKFGGGPAINVLFECKICKHNNEALSRRQHYELSVFKKYNKRELDSCAIFAISMPWFQNWQQFAHGISTKEPGPINNTNIIHSVDMPYAQSTTLDHSGGAQLGSDYVQINALIWRFLHDIYSGGPEVMLRGSLTEEIGVTNRDEDDEDEDDNQCENSNVSDTESNFGQQRIEECDREQEELLCNEQTNLNNELLDTECWEKDKHLQKLKPFLYQSSCRKILKRNRHATKNIDLFILKESLHDGYETKDNLPAHNAMLHLSEKVKKNNSAFVKYSKHSKKDRIKYHAEQRKTTSVYHLLTNTRLKKKSKRRDASAPYKLLQLENYTKLDDSNIF